MSGPRSHRVSRRAARHATAALALLVGAVACLPLPTETASPSPTATPRSTPAATPEGTATPAPTPRPYSLADPSAFDARRIRVTVVPNLPTDGSGQIVVTVTNLDPSRVQELVLRWATALDEHLFLAPFVPSPSRICDGCPPLVQPWTKWVVGPGQRGEPAGTTSLGWGPLDIGATFEIPVIANRRTNGPVEFDLQILAGEALLTLEEGGGAWLRVSVP